MKKLIIQQGGSQDNGYRIRADLLPFSCRYGVSRGERRLTSTLLKERQNDITSWLKLELVLYSNFRLDDWFVTFTYNDDSLPPSWKEAKKNLPLSIRHIREARKKENLSCNYVYVHESLHGDQRPHHHMIINAADGNADLIEDAWRRGFVKIQTIREFGGFQKLAKYITKEPREKGKPVVGERMWNPSKGLRKPERTEIIVDDNYQFYVPPDACPIDDGLSISKIVPGWLYGEFPRYDMVCPRSLN